MVLNLIIHCDVTNWMVNYSTLDGELQLTVRVEKSAEVFRKQNMMSLSVPEFFRTAGNKSATLPCFMCVLCALAL